MKYGRALSRTVTPLAALIMLVGACGSSVPNAPPPSGDAPAEQAPAADPSLAFFKPSERTRESPASSGSGAVDLASAVPDVAERSVTAVVNVSTTKLVKSDPRQGMGPFQSDPFFRHFFGPHSRELPKERRERSLGSGVIVSEDGVILTNNHVIEDASEVLVTFSDRRELKAKVVGTDPASDLAVLKLEEPPSDLSPLPIGNSDTLRLGELVLAIGNPFGMGQTVTMGIVSAKGRANMGIVDYEDFIQTDAAINPGNSGGALVNLRGELVGINTAILSRSGGYQGIGFAIPSNMVKSIMGSLLEHGKVVRGFLGVMIQDLTPALAQALELKERRGVLVSDVVEGSPAAKAGLEARDVILRIEGEVVDSAAKLRNVVAIAGVGREVKVEVVREGKPRTFAVRLEEQSGAGDPSRLEEQSGALGGLSLAPVDDEQRRRYRLPARLDRGVVVTEVAPGSPAARGGLRPGDVILEVNRSRVDDVEQLRRLYAQGREQVLIRVYREGSASYMILRK